MRSIKRRNVGTAAAFIILLPSVAEARFLQTDPVGYDDQVNLYAYVGNDPVNQRDPTGTTCTKSDGTYTCKVDSIPKDVTKSQLAQIRNYEKSYTAAVNKLAANPNAKVSFTMSGGKGTATVNSGVLANALAARKFTAAPSTPGGASTWGNVTTVYAGGLAGAKLNGVPNYGTDGNRQVGVLHEGMHGYYRGNADSPLVTGGFMSMGEAPNQTNHQRPYNRAAADLLGLPDQ